MQQILKKLFKKVCKVNEVNKVNFGHSGLYRPTRPLGYISILLLILILTSCDKFPATLRKVVNETKRADWQARSNDGDVEGAYKAAKASCCGEDTQKDDAVALKNYCRTARFWHKPSMFEIGKLYLNEGTSDATIIPYDEAIAYAYFHHASGGGNPKIEWYLASLRPKLDKREMSRTNALIEAFPQIPCDMTR